MEGLCQKAFVFVGFLPCLVISLKVRDDLAALGAFHDGDLLTGQNYHAHIMLEMCGDGFNSHVETNLKNRPGIPAQPRINWIH